MTNILVAKHSTKAGTNTSHLSVWPLVKLSHLGMQTFAKIWLPLFCRLLMRLQAQWFKDVRHMQLILETLQFLINVMLFFTFFMCSSLCCTLKLHFRLHRRSAAVMNQHRPYSNWAVFQQWYRFVFYGYPHCLILFWSQENAALLCSCLLKLVDGKYIFSTWFEARQKKKIQILQWTVIPARTNNLKQHIWCKRNEKVSVCYELKKK